MVIRRRWPGTLALQPETLIEIVKEIGDWAYHGGVRRLFIVNADVTNAAPLRCALEMLRAEHDDLMVAVINTATLSERVREFHLPTPPTGTQRRRDLDRRRPSPPRACARNKPLMPTTPTTCGCIFAHPVNRTSRTASPACRSLRHPKRKG